MSADYTAAAYITKEFIPQLPAVSPIPVTIRESQIYTFDLRNWVPSGGSVTGAASRVTDTCGNQVAGAASETLNGNVVSVTVAWSTGGIVPGGEYWVWVTATLSDGEIVEGYARFMVMEI
jgi:hypothetical protein